MKAKIGPSILINLRDDFRVDKITLRGDSGKMNLGQAQKIGTEIMREVRKDRVSVRVQRRQAKRAEAAKQKTDK